MYRLSGTKRELLRIALPAVAGFLSLILYDLIDIFWIAKLGTETVAGVAASEYWSWGIQAVMGAVTVGCATLVSQAVGAGRTGDAYDAVRESVHLSLLMSTAMAVGVYAAAPALLRFMDLSPAAFDAGLAYFRIIASVLPILHLILLGNQIFNAHGDTKTLVAIMAAALSINAALDPILMFGWFGFPAFGVSGAAYATVSGWTFGLAARVFYLRRRGYIPPLRELLRPSGRVVGRILSIGAPTAASRLIWASVYPLLTPLVTRFGMAALAGMTISHRVESIAYFTCMGFSIATATVVGRRVGRGDLAGARAAAYEARSLVSWILAPISLAFVLFPEVLLSLLSDDPAVVAAGALYMRAIGVFEIFLGWETVFEGAFSGMGNTRPYMYISVPLTLGRFPGAYLATVVLGWGVGSIFLCIAVSTMLKGILMNAVFRRTSAI